MNSMVICEPWKAPLISAVLAEFVVADNAYDPHMDNDVGEFRVKRPLAYSFELMEDDLFH